MYVFTRKVHFGGFINGYMVYLKERRLALLRENSNLSLPDVGRICGAEWKQLSDRERTSWKQQGEFESICRKASMENSAKNVPSRRDRLYYTGRQDRKHRTTPFFEFMKRERKFVKETHPKMGCAGHVRLLAEKYRSLEPGMRRRYVRVAALFNARVDRRLKANEDLRRMFDG